MTNKCTIISQIVTLLHISTLSCHPQGVCNQYLAKLHNKYQCDNLWNNCTFADHSKKLKHKKYIRCFYLLYNTATCFGFTFWPSSGSYKFDRRVHYIRQVITDNCQNIRTYIIECNKDKVWPLWVRIPESLPT